MEKIQPGAVFGYSQCDINPPKQMRGHFTIFSSTLNITNLRRQEFISLIEKYAEMVGSNPQPQGMLIFCFELTNGTIITSLPLFYLELELLCTKNYRFVEYTPVKYFNDCQCLSSRRRESQL